MNTYPNTLDWLLKSDEPWTRYRTRLDLLEHGDDAPDLIREREDLLDHPQILQLVAQVQSWPGYALKRHDDAKHPIQALAVLADFGLKSTDLGLDQVVGRILDHQSEEGAFETLIHLYKRFGGLEGEYWVWMGCDAPLLLYALAAFGCGDLPQVQLAREQLTGLITENGWPCSASPKLGNFKGPGRREDPCPMSTLQGLKALSQFPKMRESHLVTPGIEMLLSHWENQVEIKYYLFGIGTDYRKIKYPLIWYDILHAADVLSMYPAAAKDPRFRELVRTLTAQSDEDGRFTAASMYRAWKGWSFADKKQPSPWLTFLVERIQKRIGD